MSRRISRCVDWDRAALSTAEATPSTLTDKSSILRELEHELHVFMNDMRNSSASAVIITLKFPFVICVLLFYSCDIARTASHAAVATARHMPTEYVITLTGLQNCHLYFMLKTYA